MRRRTRRRSGLADEEEDTAAHVVLRRWFVPTPVKQVDLRVGGESREHHRSVSPELRS